MKRKSKLRVRNIKFIFTFFTILYCLIGYKDNGYDFIFLMPITYFICIFLTKEREEELKNNIAVIAIEILTFIKYSIMPFIIVFIKDFYSGVLTSQIPNEKYIFPSILLCCLECLSIYVTMHVFFRNKRKTDCQKITKNIKFGTVMKVFMVIALVFVFIYRDSFLPKQLFVIDENYENNVINSSIDGMIKIIFYLFKVILLLYVTQFFSKSYKEKKGFLNIVSIFLSLVVYLGVNTSTSRWSLVLPVLVYIYILRDIWFSNKINKTIIYTIGIILSISFISISMFKFNWLFNNQEQFSLRSVVGILGAQLQEYVSGPRAIAQGIETIEVYRKQINFQTCLNDFTGSIPYISKYINQDNRINIYYNYILKGTSRAATQIMPMITIGAAYFSYVFCYIFIIACIYLCLYYGEKEKNSKDLFRKYMYSLISIRFALCIGFNTQIIFAWYVSNFIPFMIIINFNDLIKEK